MIRTLLSIVALVLLAAPVYAQGGIPLGAPIRTVVSALPGAPTNVAQTYIVTDGAGNDDCAVGSGSILVHCAWTGAAWQALGGGTGTGTVDGLSADSGGTTTGATVTIAGGTNVTTTRSVNTITIDASGGGHTIEDEGTPLTQRATLNFVGAQVACADDAGNSETDCTVSGDGTGVSGIAATTGGTATGATVTIAGSGLASTSRSTDTITVAVSTDAANLTGTLAPARLGADSIDAITEVAAAIKSGTGSKLATEGTLDTTNALVKVDANDNVTETACTENAGALDCLGNISGTAFVGDDVDGSNYVELYDNPSTDVTAPTGDNVRLFTKDDQRLYMKRSGDGAGEEMLVAGQEFAWVSVADSDADDYTTKLYLGNWDEICTADDTPVTCCDTGVGVGVCDGFSLVRGSCIALDDANNEIDLLCPGVYAIESRMAAGFAYGGSSDECMAFELFNETGAAALSPQTVAIVGSQNMGTTSVRRSGTQNGYAVVDVTTPISVSVYAKKCPGVATGTTFPTTNTVGYIIAGEPSPPIPVASILVRRID